MLNLQRVNHPRADDLFILVGKISRLAIEFEDKCKAVRNFGYTIKAIKAGSILSFDDLVAAIPKALQLARTIADLPHLQIAGDEEVAILDAARKSRNQLIHEGLNFPLRLEGSISMKTLTLELDKLRVAVRRLAEGEKLVGFWLFAIEEGKHETVPTDFLAGYVDSLEQWVFASVWDLLSHQLSEKRVCTSAQGNIVPNYEWLPENLRPR